MQRGYHSLNHALKLSTRTPAWPIHRIEYTTRRRLRTKLVWPSKRPANQSRTENEAKSRNEKELPDLSSEKLQFNSPPSKSKTKSKTTPIPNSIPLILASFLVAGISLYSVQLILAITRSNPEPGIQQLSNQTDVAPIYESTAAHFDSDVGISEWLMGILSIRRQLAQRCTGHVLEVSCGTGRNLGYFDLRDRGSAIESLTLVDLSPKMLEICRRKWEVLLDERGVGNWGSRPEGLKRGLVVRFWAGSAVGEMPPPPPPLPTPTSSSSSPSSSSSSTESRANKGKYTTILQTMGLCSTPAPQTLLLNLARHLDASDPDARILLLEHGRSYADWLNRILDSSARAHAARHGCWFNREIGALVRQAAEEAGLEVVSERRHHLGTTWVFELKAGEKLRLRQERVEADEGGERGEGGKSWWGWGGIWGV